MAQITAGQSVKRDFKLNREQLEQTVLRSWKGLLRQIVV